MKKISEQLKEHLASTVTTLCYCWKLKLRSGIEKGFTDCDHDLKIDGVTYYAHTGFSPSAIASSSTLAVDNLDIDGILDSYIIAEEDILAGMYDYAEIDIFLVNYNDLTMGKLNLRTGWFGEISFSKNRFTTEVRGLMQAFSKNIGDLYSPVCRAAFCDKACALKVESYTLFGRIKRVISKACFEVEDLAKPNGYFSNGLIKFSDGQEMEVKSYYANRIETVMPLYKDIYEGQEFEIIAGCDKQFNTCVKKFNNAINFRGEPHIPVAEKLGF